MSCCKYLRNFSTLQEKRFSLTYLSEEEMLEPIPRAKRNNHNLPSSWDDINRNFQRNWKKFRKTRWK
jgi:hypothetical protein